MIITAGFERRHQIGHIANDEQIAGVAVGHDGGVHSGIATPHHNRLGRLPLLGEAVEEGAIFFIIVAAEALEAVNKFFDVIHG